MIQLIDDLTEKKNYTDMKKAAEDRSVWRTVRRDFHKPASKADNSRDSTHGSATHKHHSRFSAGRQAS